jgi:hypothetical protein
MSSRLVRTRHGRVVFVEITTPVPVPELEVGFRFVVLGDELRRPHGIGFTGEPTGRAPLPDEAAGARRRVGTHTKDRLPWTVEQKRRALELVDAGMSWAAAGREVGAPKSTVQVWVSARRNGNAVAGTATG